MSASRPNVSYLRPRLFFDVSCRARRAAFTLVEALVAISIMALAGSVLFLAATSSLETLDDAVRRVIAEGMADQLLNEVVTKRYMESGESPTAWPLGPAPNEASGNGRELFDDTDDFHQFSAQPAEGVWGEELGTGDDLGGQRHPNFVIPDNTFDQFRQRVRVYYVDPANLALPLADGQVSDYRAVEVAIDHVRPDGSLREIAVRRRVYAYLPPPP
jgi:type II secretory pathway pseudopilin PulG